MESKNTSSSTPHRTLSPRVFLVGLGILLVIIVVYGAYYYFKHKPRPIPENLSPEQVQVITQQLNTYAEQHPLSDADRYQMITGKPMATSTKATTTAPSSKK